MEIPDPCGARINKLLIDGGNGCRKEIRMTPRFLSFSNWMGGDAN